MGEWSGRLVAGLVLSVLAALGQRIPVNYPSEHGYRFVRISLDGFQEHLFEATEKGSTVEMKGILLSQFLRAAGWNRYWDDERYRVTVQGRGRPATFTLPECRSLSGPLLIRVRNGKRVPWEDRPLLVVIGRDGVVVETIPGVVSVRISAEPME